MMRDNLLKLLFSNRTMAFLVLLFPTAMALGTFIESWYNIETARIWIYNAWWFEAIMVLLALNFAGNIFKYKLLRKEKWAVLLLHLSFILILFGAFVTRYFGYEGVMPIREGETTSAYLTEKTYLTVLVDGEIDGVAQRKKLQGDVLFSAHVNNSLQWENEFDGTAFTIDVVGYIEEATEGLVLDENGDRYLKIVEAGSGTRHDHYLKEGDVANIHNVLFTLNNPIDGAINISAEAGLYYLSSPYAGNYLRMADQQQGEVVPQEKQELALRSLYTLGNFQFVIPEPPLRGRMDIIAAESDQPTNQDALQLTITSGGETQSLTVLGGKGVSNDPKKVRVGNLDFFVQYGSLQQQLPFALRLNDFIAEKYPGTEKSYASFKSKLTIEDQTQGTFDYDVYMNHVLDHRGFRFFQASFDPDEKGTVLSINHDRAGTWITYIGYILLYLSMMGIFFVGKTRFVELSKSLDKLNLKKRKLTLILLLVGMTGQAQIQSLNHRIDFDSIIQADAFAPEHAAKFGRLVIQDAGGRMKPANTFSSELLRKVSKSDTYKGLNSDQVLLSIANNPVVWYNVPIIYLKHGNDSLRRILGVAQQQKYAPLVSFFDREGNYKLGDYLAQAYRAAVPNQFQKDFIEVDRRVNLLYAALEGKILRVFPLPEDSNNKWVSYPEITPTLFSGRDSLYVNNILPLYFQSLRLAQKSNDYEQADGLLESISGFQQKFGAAVLPSTDKIAAEIWYNKYDIFKKLFSWYLYAGSVLFILLLVYIFRQNKIIKGAISGLNIIVYGLFLLHTTGLILRWFISGHAPWSDAYESMIYVAWATQFFGIIFGRKNALTLAATSFVTAMILMIAHWNWMDPAIANLQPVLDSYWLMIHVAVIVGSYGPFALGMIIGIVVLLLMLFTTNANKTKISLQIQELTIINELSITVGLVMLTIGNFLGAMWANESWGRYWGWDPKETWALISIMFYAFVIHMRLVPGLRSRWIFNLMSIVAFASILMTYFGVNFYLVGLHSYASGDKIITPDFVYYGLVFITLLGGASYWAYKKHYA